MQSVHGTCSDGISWELDGSAGFWASLRPAESVGILARCDACASRDWRSTGQTFLTLVEAVALALTSYVTLAKL